MIKYQYETLKKQKHGVKEEKQIQKLVKIEI